MNEGLKPRNETKEVMKRRNKTREKIVEQEANIVKAEMNAKAAEMDVLATREGVSEEDAKMYTQQLQGAPFVNNLPSL